MKQRCANHPVFECKAITGLTESVTANLDKPEVLRRLDADLGKVKVKDTTLVPLIATLRGSITGVAKTLRDITDAAVEVKALKSNDGNVLLFNAHVSSSPAPALCFPAEEDGLPDKFARLLFRMSSILPPKLMAAAKDEGYAIAGPARGFVFNADLVSIVRFLDIGTRVASTVR